MQLNTLGFPIKSLHGFLHGPALREFFFKLLLDDELDERGGLYGGDPHSWCNIGRGNLKTFAGAVSEYGRYEAGQNDHKWLDYMNECKRGCWSVFAVFPYYLDVWENMWNNRKDFREALNNLDRSAEESLTPYGGDCWSSGSLPRCRLSQQKRSNMCHSQMYSLPIPGICWRVWDGLRHHTFS